MDFRRLTFSHGDRPSRLRHGLFTYERWRTNALGGRYGTTLVVEFDTDRDRRVDRELRIRRKDGRLWAGMFQEQPYFDDLVSEQVRVWRPNRRGVKIAFQARLLGKGIRSYTWRVWWFDRGGLECPGSCGTDFAPKRGWFKHVHR
jgi:hypothetical protein